MYTRLWTLSRKKCAENRLFPAPVNGAPNGYISVVDNKAVSTREVQERLTHLLADVNSQLVSRWLKDPKVAQEDIEETMGLMLQVVAGLMGEIDVFIGSVETAGDPGTARSAGSPAEETEMVDLVSDEPIASLLSIDAPFHLAEGSV